MSKRKRKGTFRPIDLSGTSRSELERIFYGEELDQTLSPSLSVIELCPSCGEQVKYSTFRKIPRKDRPHPDEHIIVRYFTCPHCTHKWQLKTLVKEL